MYTYIYIYIHTYTYTHRYSIVLVNINRIWFRFHDCRLPGPVWLVRSGLLLRRTGFPATRSGHFTVCELENGHRNSWFTHEAWWFSIVFLVCLCCYQRVTANFSSGKLRSSVTPVFSDKFMADQPLFGVLFHGFSSLQITWTTQMATWKVQIIFLQVSSLRSKGFWKSTHAFAEWMRQNDQNFPYFLLAEWPTSQAEHGSRNLKPRSMAPVSHGPRIFRWIWCSSAWFPATFPMNSQILDDFLFYEISWFFPAGWCSPGRLLVYNPL